MQEKADFKLFDRTLDDVGQMLQSVAEQESLASRDIERWHWDEPDITLRWTGRDHIQRSVHAWLEGEDRPTLVVIEANAWLDEDTLQGSGRIRHWRNSRILTVDPTELSGISDGIWQAYKTAYGWERSDLRDEKIIVGR